MIPVQNQHTQPVQLCPILTTDLNTLIKSCNSKGTLLRIAAIVSAVALVVLFAGMAAIYLTLLATPPTWAMLLSLAAGFAAMKGLNCWKQGSEEFAQSASLKQITQEMSDIGQWGTPEIEAYFEEQQLTLETITENPLIMDALREINDEPLKALLPLIARERVLKKELAPLKEIADIHIQKVRKHEDPQIIQMCLTNAIENREGIAFNIFSRALLLQNLLKPDHIIAFGEHKDGEVLLVDRINDDASLLGRITMKDSQARTIEYVSMHPFINQIPRNFYTPTAPAARGVNSLTVDRLNLIEPSEARNRIFGDQ